jgi:hypothetical protein
MPMSIRFLEQVRSAFSHLNPTDIRESSERPIRILIQAASPASSAELEDYLTPATLSHDKRMMAAQVLTRSDETDAAGKFQLVFYERGTLVPDGWTRGVDAFPFDPAQPEAILQAVLDAKPDYGLALARLFPPFRAAFVRDTIHSVSKENALFSLMTALPNVVPSFTELPWAIGEFASDTTILTANQIRMAFLLAGASDRVVGYKEQRSEIGSIVAGAWGWRTVARELAGKIPFGGGLLPKAAIAYAGTYVVGLSLERVYRIGYGLTRHERKESYQAALHQGREVASELLNRLKKQKS